MSVLNLTITPTPGFPAGTVLGGYLVTLTGAKTGALPAFLVPVDQAKTTTPTLAADVYTGTITNVGADGMTPVPGAPSVSIPSFDNTGAGGNTVTLDLATAGVLSAS